MIQQYNMCHWDLGITICDVVHTICRLSIYWQPDMHAFLMQYSLSMKYQYSLGPTQYETMQVYARYKSLKHMYAWYSACNAINVPVSAFFKLAQIGDPAWSWSSLSTACGRPCSWGVDQPIIDQVPPPTFVQGMSPSLLLNSSLPWNPMGPHWPSTGLPRTGPRHGAYIWGHMKARGTYSGIPRALNVWGAGVTEGPTFL